MTRANKNTLDNLWSKLIKLRASERCEICGDTRYLNSHHVFSRSSKSVRWNIDNGVCLCAGCHTLRNTSAHKAPAWFLEQMKEKRGEKWYKDLQTTWAIPQKMDYQITKMLLDFETKKYETSPQRLHRFND